MKHIKNESLWPHPLVLTKEVWRRCESIAARRERNRLIMNGTIKPAHLGRPSPIVGYPLNG